MGVRACVWVWVLVLVMFVCVYACVHIPASVCDCVPTVLICVCVPLCVCVYVFLVGFDFSDVEPSALVQKQGGPCAVIAPVQAYLLKIIIMDMPGTQLTKVSICPVPFHPIPSQPIPPTIKTHHITLHPPPTTTILITKLCSCNMISM